MENDRVALVLTDCVVIFDSEESAKDYLRLAFEDSEAMYADTTWSIKPICAP